MTRKFFNELIFLIVFSLCLFSCKRKETVENQIAGNKTECAEEKENHPGLDEVTSEFYGTYISEKYLAVLKETKNVIKANKILSETDAMNFIYLNLEKENAAFGILNFHEGTEVFKLSTLIENGTKILIDEKGNRYLKVSDNSTLEESSEYIENYILKELFAGFSNIKVEGNTVFMNGKKYQVYLDSSFCKTDKANVILRDDDWNHYFVEILENSINVYGSEQDDIMIVENTGNLILTLSK